MKKEQLLKLIDLGLFNTGHVTEIAQVLDLTNEQVDIILKYQKIEGVNYKEFVKEIPSQHWDFVLELASKINNEQRVIAFMAFATDKDLLNSDYYEFTLIKIANVIDDEELVEVCYRLLCDEDLVKSVMNYGFVANLLFDRKLIINLAYEDKYGFILTNEDLLESKYYQFVVNTLVNIKNVELISTFGDIACDCKLMQSNYYQEVILNASLMQDVRFLNCYEKLVCNSTLLDSVHYHFALELFLDIKDLDICRHFVDLAINENLLKHINYQYVIEIAHNIYSPGVLSMFQHIATNEKLLQVGCGSYKSIISMVSNIDTIANLTYINKMIDDEIFLQSEHYEYAISLACQIDEPEVLDNFVWIARNKKLLNSQHYKYVLELASKIDNEHIMDAFGSIAANSIILEKENYKELIKIISEVKSQTAINIIYAIINKISYENDLMKILPRIAQLNYENQNIKELIDLIYDNRNIFNSFKQQEIFNQIISIFSLNNVEIVEELIDKYMAELIKIRETFNQSNQKYEEFNLEKEVQKYQLPNVLAKFPNDIKDIISNSFEDDEEINSKTFVKAKVFK